MLTSCSRQADCRLKRGLTIRHATAFYGAIYPYFQPLLSLVKLLKNVKIFCGCSGRTIKWLKRQSEKVPETVKHCVWATVGIVGWYIDFIKDILIAQALLYAYTEFWDFKSMLVVISWVTVFLSQAQSTNIDNII